MFFSCENTMLVCFQFLRSSVVFSIMLHLNQRLKKVQRRAIRFVTSNYSNYEEGTITRHMQTPRWKHVKTQRKAETICLFNQGLNSLANISLEDLSQPQRRSRHMHDKHLNIPYARTNIYEFSFLSRAIKPWNSLPNSLFLNTDNIEAFEAKIKDM